MINALIVGTGGLYGVSARVSAVDRHCRSINICFYFIVYEITRLVFVVVILHNSTRIVFSVFV